MHKKIFVLCFMTVSSFIFCMEKIDVTLGCVDNRSNTIYWATYGPGHKTIFHPNQKINLNCPLFNVTAAKQFPIEKKIIFNEQLPAGCPLEGWTVLSLNITAIQYCLLNIKNLLQEENHTLATNTDYILNVLIDQENNLKYELIK